MSLQSGTRIGQFEIVALIGSGGMGEVYRARDTRLNRDVAIKVLPDTLAGDPERIARFQREAQVLAALNHPNIAQIYGFEDFQQTHALVMECVEGPTLADRIALGPVPLDEALAIARQIADALETAHEQGIIHRDLKPANVKVRADGTVKVLDFGLAKLADAGAASGSGSGPLSMSPTMMSPVMATGAGVILGTASYMSPEQAAGKAVDRRADLWALGVILLEMLTGRQVFGGETISHVLASVLKDDPDLSKLHASTPLPIRRLLRRCLEKDRRRRLDSAAVARIEIDDAQRSPGDAQQHVSARKPAIWVRSLPWALAAVLVAAFATVAVLRLGERSGDPLLVRFAISPPDRGRFVVEEGLAGVVVSAISADGTQIAFPAAGADGKARIWLRTLSSVTARPLDNTESGLPGCWSPNGSSLAFYADRKLKKLDISGGVPVPLADVAIWRGCAWSQGGVILFGANASGPLSRVAESGGPVTAATVLDASTGEAGHRFPALLPDGKHFLYTSWNYRENGVKIHVGALDEPASSRTLLDATSYAVHSDGYVLYQSGSLLRARPFDAKTLAFTGEAVTAADHLMSSPTVTGLATFAASPKGWLLYQGGYTGDTQRLVWLDRSGRPLQTLGEPAEFVGLQLSPDRKSALVNVGAIAGNHWIYDTHSGQRTLAVRDMSDSGLTWSHDGRMIFFRKGGDIYRQSLDGGSAALVLKDAFNKFPLSMSPDGKALVYFAVGDPRTGSDVWILPNPMGPPGVSKPFAFLRGEGNELGPQFSPDGRWIAFYSDESGRSEVYVAPYPGPGRRRQISPAGGDSPRWRPDGKELFYISAEQKLVATEIRLGATDIETGAARALFDLASGGQNLVYDVSADGQRILAATPGSIVPPELTVVQNWRGGLKK